MTRQVLDKMPEAVVKRLDYIRRKYNGENSQTKKNEIRSKAASYLQALRDAGLITERERQVLFIYTTV